MNGLKVQLARLLIMVSPFMSAFNLIYETKQWGGAKEIQKEVLDEGEAANRAQLFARLNKDAH